MTSTSTNRQEITHIEDEAVIRACVQQLVDAWNAGDGQALGVPFAEDADFMVWNGLFIKGRQAIAEGHQQLFNTIFKDTTNEMTVEAIRFLRDDVAVARVSACVYTAGGEKTGTPFRSGAKPLFVLTKTAGRWQIDAFQNTPVVPMPDGPTEQS